MMDANQPLLEVRSLARNFGRLAALDNVSFSLDEGEIVGLIGPNGAGKTTLVATLSGSLRPSSGEIVFRGRNVAGLRADQIVRLGIVRTFQVIEPFKGMSVVECVMLGALFGVPEGHSASLGDARQRAGEVMALAGLEDKAAAPAEDLNMPDRKRLEIARALAARPRLLLLDEVFSGLNGAELTVAVDLVKRINATGVSIIVIEHIFNVIKYLAKRAIVLDHGVVIADDSIAEVVANRAVNSAYLGSGFKDRPGEEGRASAGA
jgi:branched-chain amino acid transport system ATP-binding protein